MLLCNWWVEWIITVVFSLQDLECVCSCSSENLVLFGEATGGICQVGRKWQVDFWKAYKVSLASMAFDYKHNVLVTLGVREVRLAYKYL